MIEQIRKCQKCGLCLNQKPLLDIENIEKNCQVFWVGLSAKKISSDTKSPLSPKTNTGMVIHKIEEMYEDVSTYKTNLVKCLPLTKQKKMRYPNQKEIDSCFENLINEITAMSPKIVFLLGRKVYSSVEKHLEIKLKKWDNFNYHYVEYKGTFYVPIHHPSYIYVYKRKYMDEYIEGVEKIINQLL